MNAMQIQRCADAPVRQEYGCGFRRILPWQHAGPSDNGMGLAIVPPGGTTQPHEHDEHEHFVVVRGHGRVIVDGTSEPVAYGDVVVVSPGARHQFVNGSETESLDVLCLWTVEAFGVTKR